MKGEVGPGVVIQDGGGGLPQHQTTRREGKIQQSGQHMELRLPNYCDLWRKKKSLFCLIPQLLLL